MRRVRRLLYHGFLFILILCTTGCAYNLYANRRMNQEVVRLPRNPDSVVIRGTEAVTLPGQGPNAALLVHGFVGSRIDYNDLGEILQARGLTVRLMRLPGHGTFPVDHATTTREELIRSVQEEYLALKHSHPQVALVGFSMGGALSIQTAASMPVDRMVLIAPYFGVTHRWYYILPAEFWNGMLSWMIPYVVKSNAFTCVNIEEAKEKLFSYKVISTRGAGELIRLGKETRDPAILARVTCPVLVLHSHGDQAASPSRSEEAFEMLGSKDKRFVWYERSNHHILWDYDREAAKQEIVDFLKPVWDQSTEASERNPDSSNG